MDGLFSRTHSDPWSTFVRWTVTLLLVVAGNTPASSELLIGKGKSRSECYVAANIASSHLERPLKVNSSRSRVTLDACGDTCDFGLQLCTNVKRSGCRAKTLRGVLVFGDTGDVDLTLPPPDADVPTEDNCARAFNPIALRAGEVRRFGLSARAKGRPRRDDDSFRLACRPSTSPCCGDGVATAGEECDDDNLTEGDGCDSNCTRTRCGNGVVTAPEKCDDGNVIDGDGCDSNCTAGCGNGIVGLGEECEGQYVDPDTICDECKLVPRSPCQCRAPAGTLLPDDIVATFTWSPPPDADCGSARAGGGIETTKFKCGRLYTGGGPINVNDPFETGHGILTMHALCLGEELKLSGGGEPAGCTLPGCLFGEPISFVGPAGPTCLFMSVSGTAGGRIDCARWNNVEFRIPLQVELFLPKDAGLDACPRCSGFTRDTCSTDDLIAVGSLQLPTFALRAPAPQKVAETLGTDRVFCGYCAQPFGCFDGDPDPSCGPGDHGSVTACDSQTPCNSATSVCIQGSPGAFGVSSAETARINAAPPGNLGDFLPHAATLGSVFCVPPTFARVCPDLPCPPNYEIIVDYVASLPGPAAVSLRGQLQLSPAPPAGD